MNRYCYGVEVPPRSIEDLRKCATLIRQDLGLGPDDPFPVAEILEFVLPKLDEDFAFEVCSGEEMGNNHGLTIPSQNTIKLREDVYEGMCDGSGQHRFTAVHEFSHYVLLDEKEVALAKHQKNSLPIYCNSEWQADALAAELLMPYEGCRGLSIDEIKDKYLVSHAAARKRFEKLRKEGCR